MHAHIGLSQQQMMMQPEAMTTQVRFGGLGVRVFVSLAQFDSAAAAPCPGCCHSSLPRVLPQLVMLPDIIMACLLSL